MVGCLLYLTATRLDIMYAASLLSRFMNEPSELHFQATKIVLRYVRGCLDLGIWFRKAENLSLYGFIDSDWGAISWISKKQEVVAQSTAEAEYVVAVVAAVNQLTWLGFKVGTDSR
ncbi:uncharacterized protein LOC116142263 [Pistacia vera]|uniref:uncharacterized protein LOC116142263 n=1 Tax=Pistacia vera TaxID=55513 RepID=UPI0012635E9A|nr:uncharacterized protein LOC116142263 [Pistacia vera]